MIRRVSLHRPSAASSSTREPRDGDRVVAGDRLPVGASAVKSTSV